MKLAKAILVLPWIFLLGLASTPWAAICFGYEMTGEKERAATLIAKSPLWLWLDFVERRA